MAITNKVRFTLSDLELSEINTALDTLYRILAPKTISLTPKQRRSLAKIGDKSLAFAEKAIELGNQNLCPGSYPSIARFQTFYSLYRYTFRVKFSYINSMILLTF